MRRLTAILLAALPCAALAPSLRISQYPKRTWQVEDGLPHNYVMSVLPAAGGYLLVATDEGLARFDGVRFTPFDAGHSLSKRWVLTMMAARSGGLWTGTFDGWLYRTGAGAGSVQFNAKASVFAIAEDAAGAIWASTRNGVLRSSPGGFAPVAGLARPPDTAWNTLAADARGAVWIVTVDGLFRCHHGAVSQAAQNRAPWGEFLSVYAAPGGVVWAGTTNGLFRVRENGAAVELEPQPDVPGPVVAMLQDHDAVLWAATWGNGLYRAAGAHVDSWAARDGLPDDYVRTLYEDGEHNLWIGTRAGGLSRWKDAAMVSFGTPEGLSGNFASTAVADANGGLWLGTWRSGLYRYSEGAFTAQSTPLPTLYFAVRAMAVDRLRHLWVGNWEGLFRFDGSGWHRYTDPATPYRHVAAILFDRLGRLWIGASDSQGVFLIPGGEPGDSPPEALLPGAEVTCLHEDTTGRVWVGTPLGGGWFGAGGRPAYHPVAALQGQALASISEDAHGRIWAATLGGGLWLLTPEGATVFDRRQGLPGHPLFRALDDGCGSLWISSPKGILRIFSAQIDQVLGGLRTRLDVVTYDRDAGMRTIECHRISQPAGSRDGGGNLWFPTTRGFVRIGVVPPPPATPPRVFIEEASADGTPLDIGPELRLDTGVHTFEVRYTALRFAAPQALRFRYRMEGFDPDWIEGPATRTARYNRLPPGRYRLLVAAADPGGGWSEPAAIAVRQLPLFYQTLWFALLLALAAAAATLGLFRWRLHLIRGRYAAITAERNRIGREWHDSLVAGFSAISLQLEATLAHLTNQPERAAEIIEVTRHMVHHYRAEARRVIWDLRDTRPEFEELTEAIASALRQATEGRGIEASVQVTGERQKLPEDLEHNMLRICQEAFANAVRHGKPSRLEVLVDYAPACLRLRIRDDGTGFEPHDDAAAGHFGLTVMQERAHRFGGDLCVESQPGAGTTVEAAIPLEEVRPA
jgi:signal transduction histidine kinase/ligand-binding sensor domain-containing protein